VTVDEDAEEAAEVDAVVAEVDEVGAGVDEIRGTRGMKDEGDSIHMHLHTEVG